MIIEDKYKEKIKIAMVEAIIQLINNIELYFSKSFNRITPLEIDIICDVIYDELVKKGHFDKYEKCIDVFFANGLYTAIDKNIHFDFKCLKLNKLVLLNYFNCFEINHIMKIIEKRIDEVTKCKIIKFKGR